MAEGVPSFPTVGMIASTLGVPIHRVQHVLRTRKHIRPTAMAGTLRLYSPGAVALIRHELNAIDARRCSRSGVPVETSSA